MAVTAWQPAGPWWDFPPAERWKAAQPRAVGLVPLLRGTPRRLGRPPPRGPGPGSGRILDPEGRRMGHCKVSGSERKRSDHLRANFSTLEPRDPDKAVR